MKRLFLVLGGMFLVACSSSDVEHPLPIAGATTSAPTPPAAWVSYCNWLMECAPAPFTRAFADTGQCAEGYAANAALSSDCATKAAQTACPPETNDVPRTCEAPSLDAGAIVDASIDGG